MDESLKDFNAAKRQMQRQKRKANLEYSTKFLERKGIPFKDLNNGVHLRVEAKGGAVIDFWPSTGLWILKDGTRNRGIFNLYKYIRDKL